MLSQTIQYFNEIGMQYLSGIILHPPLETMLQDKITALELEQAFFAKFHEKITSTLLGTSLTSHGVVRYNCFNVNYGNKSAPIVNCFAVKAS